MTEKIEKTQKNWIDTDEMRGLLKALGGRVELAEKNIIKRIGNTPTVDVGALLAALNEIAAELKSGGNASLGEILDTLKLIKEKIMATQAEVDAVAAQLDGLKTAVAKIGSDLAAFIASAPPNVSVETLKDKVTEVATALQAVDNLVPEQPAP